MALLNVRERRVEAKIVYAGPVGAGKATNLSRIAERALPQEDMLSVDWHPASTPVFRDCDLVVKLVADRSQPTQDGLRALLRDADGVVFVADADEGAQGNNLECLDFVRRALSEPSRREIPLVVQVNKTDLPGASVTAKVLESLGVTGAHVAAAASRGDGVLETAERALADVLASLRKASLEGSPGPVGPARAEGNPLLTALRQVLRETVFQQAAELEARTVATVERALERHLARSNTQAAEMTAALRNLGDEMHVLRTAVHGLVDSLDTPPPQPTGDRPSGRMAVDERKEPQRTLTGDALEETQRLVRELSEEMKRRKWGWFR